MDFYKIGALKVFADLGALIEEDERNKTKFTDIPNDVMKIIKSHVTTFKDGKDQFNFLRHFQKKQNQDIYKYFYKKEPNYFTTRTREHESLGSPNPYYTNYNYKFYLDYINLDELLGYVNEKYKRNNKNAYIIFEYRNEINDKGNQYIEIGDIIINKNNKLQFNYGSPKGFSKEYNLPEKYNQYLNKNVWKIKNIL